MENPVKELFDTNVTVASLSAFHPEHLRCRAAVRQVVGGSSRGGMSAHSLAECYSTLTRTPPPMRTVPETARAALLGLPFEIVPLTADDYRDVLRRSVELGLAGGIVYDLIHVKAAEVWGAERIVTLNARHFRRLVVGTEIQIVEP